MLNKLQTLEQALHTLSTQYHVVATELANLKNKPNNDAKNEAIINELKHKLHQSNKHSHDLQKRLDDALRQAHDNNQRLYQLEQDNDKLAQENNELLQKNELAIERAELIQTWLYNIDNAQNSQ